MEAIICGNSGTKNVNRRESRSYHVPDALVGPLQDSIESWPLSSFARGAPVRPAVSLARTAQA